jgi:hypothetical protein
VEGDTRWTSSDRASSSGATGTQTRPCSPLGGSRSERFAPICRAPGQPTERTRPTCLECRSWPEACSRSRSPIALRARGGSASQGKSEPASHRRSTIRALRFRVPVPRWSTARATSGALVRQLIGHWRRSPLSRRSPLIQLTGRALRFAGEKVRDMREDGTLDEILGGRGLTFDNPALYGTPFSQSSRSPQPSPFRAVGHGATTTGQSRGGTGPRAPTTCAAS